jgi:hypothetical protein
VVAILSDAQGNRPADAGTSSSDDCVFHNKSVFSEVVSKVRFCLLSRSSETN